MRWLTAAMILLSMGFSVSCGCSSSAVTMRDGGTYSPQPAVNGPSSSWRINQHEAELGYLANRSYLPQRMAELLARPAFDTAELLPPLPELGSNGRLPSALQTFEKLGKDSFDASANSVNDGNRKILSALASSTSWALYQLGDLSAYTELKTLRAEITAASFGGLQPGYWIGLANYQRGSWEILANSQLGSFSRSLGSSAAYRSPAGNVFVFILVHDAQSLAIERVELDVNTPDWIEIEVDGGPLSGQTPAIDFAANGNPVVVFSDYETSIPRIAVGDRTQDLRQLGNWSLADINPQPDGVGTWLDLIIDPATGLPVVSINYVGLTGGDENSRAGFSPMVEQDAQAFFLNYQLGWVDGAVYSSIDKRNDGRFGMAISAANENHPEKPAYDMQYRLIEFDPQNWGETVDVVQTSNFGDNWRFPHLRYHPADANASVCINGGYVEYESAINDWSGIFSEVSSTAFGSLAYNPNNNLLGSTFQRVQGSLRELNYVAFDDGLFGEVQPVDWRTISTADEYVGACSQLAYAPDGTAGIAYTVCDGQRIFVKYAELNVDSWDVQDVSQDPSDPDDLSKTVLLDLDFDPSGVPAICYNHLDGATASLRVVLRGS